MSEISGHTLIQLISDRNVQAMTVLYRRYGRLIYKVAFRVLHNSALAEDVAQEVFLQIWRSPATFLKVEGDFAGWMTVVARNRAIDTVRKLRPDRAAVDISLLTLVSSSNPSGEVEREIMLEKMHRCIEALSVNQREVINLAFVRGLTHSEIVVVTGLPLGTVKTRIRVALVSLKKRVRIGRESGSEPLKKSPALLF